MATKVKTGVIDAGAITSALITDASITADDLHTTLDLTGKTVTVATASASDNDTSVASTAYVTTAIANLADSAPSTLNTLNELAAALGDDANFSTTVTNSIATKLPLAGGTMSGALNISGTSAHSTEFKIGNLTWNQNSSSTHGLLHQYRGSDGYSELQINNTAFSGAVTLNIRNDSTSVATIANDGGAYFAGNVGIGTTNPAQNFVVAASTNGIGIELVPGTLNYIQAYNRGTSDYSDLKIDAQTIRFGVDNGTEAARFDADRRLKLDATKNYGSGSTFPTYSGIGGYIHGYVNGSGSSYPRYLDIASIGSNGTGNGGNIRLIVNQNSATAGDVVAQFSLSNGSRIHDRLSVGDGPASSPIPSNTLMVRQAETSTTGGPNSGNSYFPIVVGGGTHVAGVAFGIGFDPEGYGNRNKVAIMVEGDGQGYSHGKLHFAINNAIDGQNVQIADSKMTILKTGNVGIGTDNPGWQFVVQGAGTGSGLQDGHVMIRSTTAANPAGLMFINSGNTASYNDLGSIQGIVESGNAKGALRFITRNSDGNNTDVAERMRINSSGITASGDVAASGDLYSTGGATKIGGSSVVYTNSSFGITTSAQTVVPRSAISSYPTGVYLMTIYMIAGGWYSSTVTGIVQHYGGTTNSNSTSNNTIHLTGSGHALNAGTLYARYQTFLGNANNHGVQIWASGNSTTPITITWKRLA